MALTRAFPRNFPLQVPLISPPCIPPSRFSGPPSKGVMLTTVGSTHPTCSPSPRESFTACIFMDTARAPVLTGCTMLGFADRNHMGFGHLTMTGLGPRSFRTLWMESSSSAYSNPQALSVDVRMLDIVGVFTARTLWETPRCATWRYPSPVPASGIARNVTVPTEFTFSKSGPTPVNQTSRPSTTPSPHFRPHSLPIPL